MKKLLLIRHAKSSWDSLYVSDYDRTLNERGMNDAPLMAQEMKKVAHIPQAIYTSTANRALTTATFFKEIMDIKDSHFIEIKELYHAPLETIQSVIHNISEEYEFCAVVGHNPGISEIVSHYSKDLSLYDMPTTGIAYFEFNTPNWQSCSSKNAILKGFYYPKMYQ